MFKKLATFLSCLRTHTPILDSSVFRNLAKSLSCLGRDDEELLIHGDVVAGGTKGGAAAVTIIEEAPPSYTMICQGIAEGIALRRNTRFGICDRSGGCFEEKRNSPKDRIEFNECGRQTR
ncbi:unnamed protein product, partial [Meganyctiphanes norvegica]